MNSPNTEIDNLYYGYIKKLSSSDIKDEVYNEFGKITKLDDNSKKHIKLTCDIQNVIKNYIKDTTKPQILYDDVFNLNITSSELYSGKNFLKSKIINDEAFTGIPKNQFEKLSPCDQAKFGTLYCGELNNCNKEKVEILNTIMSQGSSIMSSFGLKELKTEDPNFDAFSNFYQYNDGKALDFLINKTKGDGTLTHRSIEIIGSLYRHSFGTWFIDMVDTQQHNENYYLDLYQKTVGEVRAEEVVEGPAWSPSQTPSVRTYSKIYGFYTGNDSIMYPIGLFEKGIVPRFLIEYLVWVSTVAQSIREKEWIETIILRRFFDNEPIVELSKRNEDPPCTSLENLFYDHYKRFDGIYNVYDSISMENNKNHDVLEQVITDLEYYMYNTINNAPETANPRMIEFKSGDKLNITLPTGKSSSSSGFPVSTNIKVFVPKLNIGIDPRIYNKLKHNDEKTYYMYTGGAKYFVTSDSVDPGIGESIRKCDSLLYKIYPYLDNKNRKRHITDIHQRMFFKIMIPTYPSFEGKSLIIHTDTGDVKKSCADLLKMAKTLAKTYNDISIDGITLEAAVTGCTGAQTDKYGIGIIFDCIHDCSSMLTWLSDSINCEIGPMRVYIEKSVLHEYVLEKRTFRTRCYHKNDLGTKCFDSIFHTKVTHEGTTDLSLEFPNENRIFDKENGGYSNSGKKLCTGPILIVFKREKVGNTNNYEDSKEMTKFINSNFIPANSNLKFDSNRYNKEVDNDTLETDINKTSININDLGDGYKTKILYPYFNCYINDSTTPSDMNINYNSHRDFEDKYTIKQSPFIENLDIDTETIVNATPVLTSYTKSWNNHTGRIFRNMIKNKGLF